MNRDVQDFSCRAKPMQTFRLPPCCSSRLRGFAAVWLPRRAHKRVRCSHRLLRQTFDTHDLAMIGLLIVLEGVLSIDNALVLGLLAKRCPSSSSEGR